MSVVVRREGAAEIVVMDWPEKRNALAPSDGAELAEALEDAGGRAGSAVVLTGNGAFCAGGDLRAFARVSAEASAEQMEQHVYGTMQRVVRTLRDCPVPTIAALDGPAIGLGFDLALACDMRLLGPNGWMQQGWARAGLIAGVGGIGLLQRLNPSVMWRLIATQERVDAAAAERMWLGEAARPSALRAAAARAEELSAVPHDVLGHYARLSRAHGWPAEQHFGEAASIQARLIASPRFREQVRTVLADG